MESRKRPVPHGPVRAPSVREPERFPADAVTPFGGNALQHFAFQSASFLRSFGLSVSGAVAPSAPATRPEQSDPAGLFRKNSSALAGLTRPLTEVKRSAGLSPLFALRLIGAALLIKPNKQLDLSPILRHGHAFFNGDEARLSIAFRNGDALALDF